MQFSRLLTLAAQRFAHVGFFCNDNLLRLFEWSFADQPNIYFTANKQTTDQDWDYYTSLLSLPLALNLQLHNIPAAPCLKVRQSCKKVWQQRLLRENPKRLRIGICWMGNQLNFFDRRRSLSFEQITPLLQAFSDDITWVNLQILPENHPPLTIPAGVQWLDWTRDFYDFADTAALVSNLDLVITIDSSIVHLAGGLGVPTFLLNRYDNEWRWLHKRDKSPWYPSVHIFPQNKFADWEYPLYSLQQTLQDLLNSNHPKQQLEKFISAMNDTAISTTAASAAKPNFEQLIAKTAYLTEPDQLCENYPISEILQRLDQGLALLPGHPGVLCSKGIVFQYLGRHQEAAQCFEQALKSTANFHLARFRLAQSQLQLGDYANGWRNFQSRWDVVRKDHAGALIIKPQTTMPEWLGNASDTTKFPQKELSQQRLLIVFEYSFSDNIQFSRYVQLAAQRFASVGFLCKYEVTRLLEWSFGDYPNVTLFHRSPSDSGAWDCYTMLMSLPQAFDTTAENIPKQIPYLKVNQGAKFFWQRRLQRNKPKKLSVGICWQNNGKERQDKLASLDFAQLNPLLQKYKQEVTWVSLQKMPKDTKPLEAPQGVHWLDWCEDFHDFADTAALIANLDLVISIESPVAHLAGALGVPVFLLSQIGEKWQWNMHDEKSQNSLWYNNVRIFRQKEYMEWDSVMQAVEKALSDLLRLKTD